MCFSPILQIKPLPYLEKIVDFGCGLMKIFGKHRGVGRYTFFSFTAIFDSGCLIW